MNDQPPVNGDGAFLLDGEQAKKQAEIQLGIRCSNCREPIEEPGAIEYVSTSATFVGGQPTINVSRAVVCFREECDGFRDLLYHEADYSREVPAWTVLESS